MRKATLLFAILLAVTGFGQTGSATTTVTLASVVFVTPNGALGTLFVVRSLPGQCDVTCTALGYSFCVDPVPGCQEGSGWIPDDAFSGTVTGNYLKPDKLTLRYEAVTQRDFFENVICNAFDQYGNCIDGTVVQGDAGPIQLTFTKTPVSAVLNSNTQKNIGNDLDLHRCRRSVFGGSFWQRHRSTDHSRK